MIILEKNPTNFVGKIAKAADSQNTSKYYNLIKAWDSLPSEYGFHRSIFLKEGIFILLGHSDQYCRVLAGDRVVWMDSCKLEILK